MGFSVWNLHKIQRDKQIEAAIQRDFTIALGIAEKKTWMKATDLLTPVREKFPCGEPESEIKSEMERILAAHPEFLYAIFYNKEHNILLWRSRPSGDGDEVFRRPMAEEAAMTTKWLPTEAPEFVHKLRKTE